MFALSQASLMEARGSRDQQAPHDSGYGRENSSPRPLRREESRSELRSHLSRDRNPPFAIPQQLLDSGFSPTMCRQALRVNGNDGNLVLFD